MRVSLKDIVDFYDHHPEFIGELEVDTRHGYKRIEFADVTAVDSPVYTLITETGKRISGSPEHRLAVDDKWVKLQDFKISDRVSTRDGLESITILRKESFTEDLYDLQVEGVREFYANDIVSHNSTMLDAISFALYGKPYRNINKPLLVNSITNKQCLVEVEIVIKKKKYLVRRGIKPNVFEIYCDGKLIDQNASVREYQEMFEKNILCMNHKSFTQIVVIGSANFTPFMQLRAHERRAVIEDILDIEIFSKMYILLKERMNANKEKITQVKYQSDLCDQRIELTKKHLNELRSIEQSNQENKRKKITELTEEIDSLNQKKDIFEKQIHEQEQKIYDLTKVSSKRKQITKIGYQLDHKLDVIQKDIDFLKSHDECPTCNQSIEESFKTESIKRKDEKRQEIQEAIKQLTEANDEVETRLEEIAKIQHEISELTIKKTGILQDIFIAMNHKNNIEEQLSKSKETTDVDMSSSDLKKTKEESVRLKKVLKECIEQQKEYDIASSLLKDGGIKSRIIRQYIPIINKLMNKYLAMMDFFVQFELDESFNEKIKSRHRDEFTYDSFSEGEKARLDIALLLTWRSLAKLRNSMTTNLLIMDEVFDSSLDNDGTGYLLNLIGEMKNDTNVFIISHKGDSLYDKFFSCIRFEKIKNFSRIATV